MPIKPPPRTARIDWSRIIFDLHRCGMSFREIARECGFDDDDTGGKTWVHRLKNVPGTQPKFHDGALLLGLWAERMQMAPAAAPLEA